MDQNAMAILICTKRFKPTCSFYFCKAIIDLRITKTPGRQEMTKSDFNFFPFFFKGSSWNCMESARDEYSPGNIF